MTWRACRGPGTCHEVAVLGDPSRITPMPGRAAVSHASSHGSSHGSSHDLGSPHRCSSCKEEHAECTALIRETSSTGVGIRSQFQGSERWISRSRLASPVACLPRHPTFPGLGSGSQLSWKCSRSLSYVLLHVLACQLYRQTALCPAILFR